MIGEDESFIECVDAATYKIKPPTINEAVYITIGSVNKDGHTMPVQLFINSKNMASFQWISAVTRVVSRAFKRGEPQFIHDVVMDLIDTYDTEGGYIIPKSRGKRAKSIVSHIGMVIEGHCKRLGVW